MVRAGVLGAAGGAQWRDRRVAVPAASSAPLRLFEICETRVRRAPVCPGESVAARREYWVLLR